MKTRMLILAFALSFACASEAVAQSGEVGWSEVVGGCTVESGSANHLTSFGVVSFAPAAYGNIYLDCPVTGITRVDPSYKRIRAHFQQRLRTLVAGGLLHGFGGL